MDRGPDFYRSLPKGPFLNEDFIDTHIQFKFAALPPASDSPFPAVYLFIVHITNILFFILFIACASPLEYRLQESSCLNYVSTLSAALLPNA